MIDRNKTAIWIALLGIAAAGVWLRTRGLAFGLPAVYNPDEIAIMSRALGFATGDLNPHNFLYPTLYFYALFAWIGAYFAAGWALGAFHGAAEFERQFFTDPSGIYLAGRTLSVVCGAATIVLAGRLGRQVRGPAAGLAAAALLAVAPFAVRDAHYVKHDVPVTLAIVAAALCIDRVLKAGDDRRRVRMRVAIAGLACGIAASIHYYAIFIVCPLAVAIALRPGRRTVAEGLDDLAIAAGAAAIAFFAASPYLALEPWTALRDIAANRQIVMDRAMRTAGPFPSAGAYLRMLGSDAMGAPVLPIALLGLAVLAKERPRLAAVTATFPVLFLLFISNTVPATRYLNPVLPFLAVWAAVGIDFVAAAAARVAFPPRTGSRRVARGAVMAALALLALRPGLAASRAEGAFFRQDDTRTLARRWVERHVPDGATLAVQPYSVPLHVSRAGLVEALRAHLGDERRASIRFQKQLAVSPWPKPAYRLIWLGRGGLDVDKMYVDPDEFRAPAGLEPLRRLGVEYVIAKGYNMGRPADTPLQDALQREAVPLAVFSPYRHPAAARRRASPEPFLHNSDARIVPELERPGPVIEVWQVKGDPAAGTRDERPQ